MINCELYWKPVKKTPENLCPKCGERMKLKSARLCRYWVGKIYEHWLYAC